MSKKTRRADDRNESRSFEDCRTIDVNDQRAVRFWSRRLGVTETEIVEVVQEVGPNSTAVALKLEAPHTDRVAPPTFTPRP
jgi:hypothetical protein